MNYEFDISFKVEGHAGLITVSAPDEASARAHIASLHPHDLLLHSDMDPGDAFAIFGNKISNPNVPGALAMPNRGFKEPVQIISVTKVVPKYIGELKAELERHGFKVE